MLKKSSRLHLILFLSFLLCFAVRAEELRLAVASNFAPLLQVLILDFKAQYPASDLTLISGSSGKLYAQIFHGAPYDIFLSADQEKPARLVEQGLAVENSRFTYASGQIVLWSRDASLIHSGPEILVSSNFDKLAIANSRLAPYGVAGEQVLNRLGILETTRSRWVQGENIAQTFQFVESGNAALGLVAKSQVWRNGRLSHGSVWMVPDDWYQEINQDAVLLTRSAHKQIASVFLDFLKQEAVRQKIASFGYKTFRNSGLLEKGVEN